jgi:AraC-like DNA-binding protein
MEKMYDSVDLPPPDRLDAWYAVTSQALAPNEFSIDRPEDFRASMHVMELGASQVSALTYTSLRSQRTPKLIRQSDPELYTVGVILRGQQSIAQAGQQAVLSVNDLVAYSSFYPYDARVEAGEGTGASVVAQIPRALVPLPLHKVDRLLAVRLPGQEGINALLAQFLTRLAADTGSYRPADGPRLGAVLLDLLTALLAHHLEDHTSVAPETRTRALLLQIETFIQQHLGDARLTPTTVAAAHHISTRYLHLLFQRQGTTVSGWIRKRRLEHCRRDLADPACGLRPIHAIAARWGFTHPEQFSRAFRAAYGISPRDYREQAHHPR